MKIRGRKRRPSEDSLPSSCHESPISEPTNNHLHLQYNSHSKNNKVAGNSLIARPVHHHHQNLQQKQQLQQLISSSSSTTAGGLMVGAALDSTTGGDSDQELDKMDDCAAAMVLMSLSCSPKSPIFPNFASAYGSSSFHYFNATTTNNAAAIAQKSSSGDHQNVAHHQAFTSSSSPSSSSSSSFSSSSSSFSPSIPVSVNEVKYSTSWKSGISIGSTDSGVTIGSYGTIGNSSSIGGNTCSSNGGDEDSRSGSPSPNTTIEHQQQLMITASGEVSQPGSTLSSSPSSSPSPCSPLQVASATSSTATCSFITSASSTSPSSPHKPVVAGSSKQKLFSNHNKITSNCNSNNNSSNSNSNNNNNNNNNNNTISHMDEGLELDPVESVFSSVLGRNSSHHNFYHQSQQQQQHQQHNSHGKKRIIYECTFPGCHTRYRQNSAIERHVRTIHLGPNPGPNEEEFYYTEVEEDDELSSVSSSSSASFVFTGANIASSIMQQQQQQQQNQLQQQQLRHHQQQFVHSSHPHHQNQIQSPRRLADSPSIASSDGSSNSSHSPIPSPGPFTLGPSLNTAPPTWSHMDMVRPPHEDPEYQKQQAQFKQQQQQQQQHLTTSPINIPGVNFLNRNSSSGRTGLTSSSAHRLISHNKNKLMRVEGKPISLLASPPSLPSSLASSISSSASTSSSFIASAGASKATSNGGTSNRGRGRGETRKCRKVYGMESRDAWCTQCKWKKACTRFTD